jgi:hypothetical protein
MVEKTNPPSIAETAFDCPHCGAYTTQYWFDIYTNPREKNSIPHIPNKESMNHILEDGETPDEVKQRIIRWINRLAPGLVLLQKRSDSKYVYNDVENLYLSQCYNCNKVAVWVHKSLLFPKEKAGINPNQDLPEDIIHDFNEARSIIGESPRGAAALLRLCVQKLCVHLKEKGKSIDEDIASLVAKGLNPLVQKSLDIVRVVGNDSVHPGVIDLNDNRDIANELLALINSIADQMISHPKNVEALYGKLPENKRKAIEKRDKKQNT